MRSLKKKKKKGKFEFVDDFWYELENLNHSDIRFNRRAFIAIYWSKQAVCSFTTTVLRAIWKMFAY